MTILDERDVAHKGKNTATFRADDIANSANFRELYQHAPNLVASDEQPFERSPDGLIKHLVHEKLGTREQCVDAYMLFIDEGSRSGKHRHMWEEVIFVAEGSARIAPNNRLKFVNGGQIEFPRGSLRNVRLPLALDSRRVVWGVA